MAITPDPSRELHGYFKEQAPQAPEINEGPAQLISVDEVTPNITAAETSELSREVHDLLDGKAAVEAIISATISVTAARAKYINQLSLSA